jgi:hypothetical protein
MTTEELIAKLRQLGAPYENGEPSMIILESGELLNEVATELELLTSKMKRLQALLKINRDLADRLLPDEGMINITIPIQQAEALALRGDSSPIGQACKEALNNHV